VISLLCFNAGTAARLMQKNDATHSGVMVWTFQTDADFVLLCVGGDDTSFVVPQYCRNRKKE
jgi:hypothetical protein